MKRGDLFTHAHWLDANHRPLRCRVTRVADGVVYWKPIDGGKSMYFPITESARYVKPDAVAH